MWLLGDQHTPLHPSYWQYSDNRPRLAQDHRSPLWYTRRSHDPYRKVYYKFINSKGKSEIILNTNTPLEEREIMQKYFEYLQIFNKNLLVLSLPIISASYFTALKYLQCDKIYKKFFLFLATVYTVKMGIGFYFSSPTYLVFDRYYQKFKQIAASDFNQIEDKRREFFKPDTDVYYRETPQEIMDSKNAYLLHDSSIYYGPHPFDDHENIDSIVEMNKKFITGKSIYDDPEKELILNEKIDIIRRIRDIPSYESFSQI